ncbi:hypothetical protein PQX77_003994 [Marasmius sp. AFHP31]|nr:hypothetical protein PQX77_003994 [Marasmius sp. AFHP31]
MSGLSNSQEYARTTDWSERTNQGIVDGRPKGQNPPRAPIQRDTVVDKDASLESSDAMRPRAADILGGTTSADVHNNTMGKPGSGQTSSELHHDGAAGRKRDGQGASRWGPPGQASVELDRAQRETERDREAFARD